MEILMFCVVDNVTISVRLNLIVCQWDQATYVSLSVFSTCVDSIERYCITTLASYFYVSFKSQKGIDLNHFIASQAFAVAFTMYSEMLIKVKVAP